MDNKVKFMYQYFLSKDTLSICEALLTPREVLDLVEEIGIKPKSADWEMSNGYHALTIYVDYHKGD